MPSPNDRSKASPGWSFNPSADLQSLDLSPHFACRRPLISDSRQKGTSHDNSKFKESPTRSLLPTSFFSSRGKAVVLRSASAF